MMAWNSDEYPIDHRYDAWTSMISSTAYPWSFGKPVDIDFHASHKSLNVNKLSLKHGKFSPFKSERSRREIKQSHDPFYSLQFLVSGSKHVEHKAHNAVLRPGDVLLWDSEQDAKFEVQEQTEVFSLIIPKHILDPELKNRSDIKVLSGNMAVKNLLTTVVETTISNANSFSLNQLRSIEEAILSLTTTAFSDPIDDQRVSLRIAKLTRIKEYIRANLEDPTLSPSMVASAVGISLRDLYITFSEEEDTFMSYLQNARIVQATNDLKQNPNGFQSITEIAYKYGFSSSAQFSRVFKRHSQLTPREFRRIHS